jgi:SAM-dependent methyltransferase
VSLITPAGLSAGVSFPLEEERIRNTYARRAGEACYAGSAAGRFHFQDRERRVLETFDRYGYLPLSGKRILEIGCGTGKWLRDLVGWGADPENLFGVDLLADAVVRARRACAPGVSIECSNAANLRFDAGYFDLVLQSTAFSSVLDAGMKSRMAGEMLRVLRPGGLILWYDLAAWNPWNDQVLPIGRAELRRLFPGCSLDLQRITLAPPLVRRLAPCSWLGCYLLAQLAPLCTHYLGAIRKNGAPR